MKVNDRKAILFAMIKEVTDQINNENFLLIRRKEILEGSTLLPGAWQMKRNRNIKTLQIKRWKSRLNVDGSRMKKEIQYYKVYSQVEGCPSIRIILILVALEVWKTIQVDWVQAFSQAPIDKYLYLKVSSGFQVKDEDNNDYALKLHRDIYGQKNLEGSGIIT